MIKVSTIDNTMKHSNNINLDNIKSAASRIAPYIRNTPIICLSGNCKDSLPLSPNAKLFVKLESLQITGSFKVRGAINKTIITTKGEPELNSEQQKPHRLIAASGGNHAIAVSFAGHMLDIPVEIFLSQKTKNIYLDRVRKWGANINICGNDFAEALEHCEREHQKNGGCFIHPFADKDVICGQGTLGIELLEQIPNMDVLFIAIGGGGLIGGISCAVKLINPNIKIIGVEPENSPAMYKALKADHPVKLNQFNSIAVTLSAQSTSQINLDLAKKYVDDVILVSDREIRDACNWLWQEFFLPTEFAGAAAIAAITSNKANKYIKNNSTIASIICGFGTDFNAYNEG